jgi:hypothetical protein
MPHRFFHTFATFLAGLVLIVGALVLIGRAP